MKEIVARTTEEGKADDGRRQFSFRRDEFLAAILSYIFAYIYTSILWQDTAWMQVLLTAAFVIGTTEYLNREVETGWESRVWLACFMAVSACLAYSDFRRETVGEDHAGLFCGVFDTDELYLIVHCFAIWYVLVRSGKLLKGETSSFFPADVLNAGIIIPFKNLGLRFKNVLCGIKRAASGRKSEKTGINGWVIGAFLICALLFVFAVRLLSGADDRFGNMTSGFLELFSFRLDAELIFKIIFSIPAGMYLFGLIAGSRRMERDVLDRDLSRYEKDLASIKKIPAGFWTAVIALFSIVYLVFFVMQSQYLFGAFLGHMPQGFIVSEYARKGFFELCMIMAVDFGLLLLVTRMTGSRAEDADGRAIKLQRIACIVLLAESMLFAVIAFSKLALYISCFGFTPRRLQSAWAACVLFAAAGSWMYSLITGRKAFRKWLYLSTVSLTILCI